MTISKLFTKSLLSSLFLSVALGLTACGQSNPNDPACGNGTIEDGEQCDDGDALSGDGCSSDCQLEEDECGDGTLSAGEQCDDGNTSNGDGCSSACTDEGLSEAEQINEHVDGLGELDVAEPAFEISDPGPQQARGPYLCTNQTVSEVRVFDKFPAQGSVVNRIFPGAILAGDSLFDGSFTEITLARKPMTVSMNVGTLDSTTVMQNVTSSGFTTAQTEMFQKAILPTDSFSPKFSDVLKEDTTNLDELSLSLGFEVSTGTVTQVDVAGKLDFNNTAKRNRKLIRIVNEMYTVRVDKPSKASDFFSEAVTAEEIQGFFETGNPPVYVDTITYGRVVYISVLSNFTSTEIQAALDVAVSSGNTDVALDFGLTAKTVLEEMIIDGVVVGGISDAAGADDTDLQLLNTDPAAINRIFARSARTTFQQRGVPISFTLAYLGNGSGVKTSVDGSYPIENCNRAPIDFAVDVNALNITGASDGGAGNAQNNVEIRGSIAVSFNGNRVFLFNKGVGNEVPFVAGPVSPASSFLLDGILQDVDTLAGNQVNVEFNLVEEDGNDDDVFSRTFSIPVEELFSGEKLIAFSGAGLAGDLFIGFTPLVSPIP